MALNKTFVKAARRVINRLPTVRDRAMAVSMLEAVDSELVAGQKNASGEAKESRFDVEDFRQLCGVTDADITALHESE